MSSNTRRGTFSGDPSVGAPDGSSFTIDPSHYRPPEHAVDGEVSNWDGFNTTLVSLAFTDKTSFYTEGSGVLVSPGVALAAHHIIQPRLREIKEGRLGFHAAALVRESLVLWSVDCVTTGDGDIAILSLSLASKFPVDGFKTAILTTRVPPIGERVMIAGVRAPDRSPRGELLPVDVRIGVGEVACVYPRGRDSVMLPKPCVEVRCLTLGGMSGGPAFDKDGNLFGLLSSSFEDEEGPSYISLWWPVASTEIPNCWPKGLIPTPTSLLQMEDRRMVRIIESAALKVRTDGVLAYEPWS